MNNARENCLDCIVEKVVNAMLFVEDVVRTTSALGGVCVVPWIIVLL